MDKPEKSKVFPIYIVDAFTEHSFSGNPAAVCLIPPADDVGDDIKQKIAAEMNLSETAFPKILNDSDTFQNGKRFSLRWFTPSCEVPLCGHATLATAAVLLKECNNESQVIEFETLRGILKAVKAPNNRIQIDLPAYESHPVNGKYDKLVKAVAKDLPVNEVVLSSDFKNLLIRLCDTVTRKEFESFKTNPTELLAAADGLIGVIVTLKGSNEECVDREGNHYDFVSRYFAPWSGVPEDPVT
ncbi:Phenazine biosynthesis-like domain-containing protein, partial [Araneus ventricosus]